VALFYSRRFEDMSDEAHFSAEQPSTGTASRFSEPDVNRGRTQCDSQSPRAGPQETLRLKVIRQRRDFLAANSARRVATPGFVLLVRPREDGDRAKRLGITVTKKIGNAVVRNRMKRRFRALARELIAPGGVDGADHVLIGRMGGVERDYGVLRDDLTKALTRVPK
jgi:ribonuclease P protein component